MQIQQYWHRVVGAWDAIQVELHGQYSLDRLKAFHEYSLSTSAARVFLVIVLTPIPCVLAIVIADSIPLAPPQRGIDHSLGFWIRCVFATFVYSLAIVSQIRFYVPHLRMSRRAHFAISIPAAFLTNTVLYGIARIVGFPVPFSIPVASVPWTWFLVLFIWLLCGRVLRQNRAVLGDLLQYSLIVICQVSMIVVYPVFYSAFSSFSSSKQTLFALVLPVIKLIEKNLISRVLKGKDDLKPELVIFNVEIFNALFVSCCMQSSNSFNTNLVIMGADLLQACVSVRDLSVMLAEFNCLADKMDMEKGQFINTVIAVLREYPAITQHSSFRTTASMASQAMKVIQVSPRATVRSSGEHSLAAKRSVMMWCPSNPGAKPASKREKTRSCEPSHPQSPRTDLKLPGEAQPLPFGQSSSMLGASQSITTKDDTSSRVRLSMGHVLTADERLLFVQKALQILFLTEFLLLIEFTEVFIPLVYCVYLTVLFHLPNRIYYPQVDAMDEAHLRATIVNVFIYAAMELGSFVIMYIVLKRKLHISAIRQLAFVLEKQCEMVQSKLILWVVFMLQSTLVHLGADYSFKFAWLHAHQDGDSIRT